MAKFKTVMNAERFKKAIVALPDPTADKPSDGVAFEAFRASSDKDKEHIHVGLYVGTTMSRDFAKDKGAYKSPAIFKGTIYRSPKHPNKKLVLESSGSKGPLLELGKESLKASKLKYVIVVMQAGEAEPDASAADLAEMGLAASELFEPGGARPAAQGNPATRSPHIGGDKPTPPRPSTPAPTTGGVPPRPSTPAPTTSGAPPRPSTPAPTTGGAPPRPSTPPPTTGGAPPRPSTPAPTTGGAPPRSSTPPPTNGGAPTAKRSPNIGDAPPQAPAPPPSGGGASPQPAKRSPNIGGAPPQAPTPTPPTTSGAAPHAPAPPPATSGAPLQPNSSEQSKEKTFAEEFQEIQSLFDKLQLADKDRAKRINFDDTLLEEYEQLSMRQAVPTQESMQKVVDVYSRMQKLRNTIQAAIDGKQWQADIKEAFEKNQYTKGQILGQGAYGQVVSLEMPGGKPLAIKTVTTNNPAYMKIQKDSWDNEVKAYEEVGEHPNIARCFGVQKVGDLEGLVLERINGGDMLKGMTNMRAKFEEGAITQQEFWGVMQFAMQRTLEVLDHMQSNGWAHLDIKPENIMWDEDSGEIKVVDMGIADLEWESTMGTTGYQAPEASADMGNLLSHQSDVFSLGAVAYFAGEVEKFNYAGKGAKQYGEQGAEPVQQQQDSGQGGAKPIQSDLKKPGEFASGGGATAYVDFLKEALKADRGNRPTAKTLLDHPFMKDRIIDDKQATDLIKGGGQKGAASPGAKDKDEDSDTDLASLATKGKLLEATYQMVGADGKPQPLDGKAKAIFEGVMKIQNGLQHKIDQRHDITKDLAVIATAQNALAKLGARPDKSAVLGQAIRDKQAEVKRKLDEEADKRPAEVARRLQAVLEKLPGTLKKYQSELDKAGQDLDALYAEYATGTKAIGNAPPTLQKESKVAAEFKIMKAEARKVQLKNGIDRIERTQGMKPQIGDQKMLADVIEIMNQYKTDIETPSEQDQGQTKGK